MSRRDQCGGRLDIKKIAGLKRRLTARLQKDGPIIIDASGLEDADTAVLQLLTAFILTADNRSRDIHWEQPSDVLLELSGLLDLKHYLRLDSVECGEPENQLGVELCPVF